MLPLREQLYAIHLNDARVTLTKPEKRRVIDVIARATQQFMK